MSSGPSEARPARGDEPRHTEICGFDPHNLANYRREAGFNRINLENGYPAIRIIGPWRSYRKAKTKKLDAVAESRKWKEAGATETEGMTPEETMACFARAAVRRRFEAALRQADQTTKRTRKKGKK
jgi:hypothetical protein